MVKENVCNKWCDACIFEDDTCCTSTASTFLTFGDVKRISKFIENKKNKNRKEFRNLFKFRELGKDDTTSLLFIEKKHPYYYELVKDGKLLQLKKNSHKCALLNKNNCCMIYPARPLICKAFPFWYKKSKGEIKVTIDQNASETCPVVKGRKAGSEATKQDYKEMCDTNKRNLSLMKKLDKEIEEYRKTDASEILSLIKKYNKE